MQAIKTPDELPVTGNIRASAKARARKKIRVALSEFLEVEDPTIIRNDILLSFAQVFEKWLRLRGFTELADRIEEMKNTLHTKVLKG